VPGPGRDVGVQPFRHVRGRPGGQSLDGLQLLDRQPVAGLAELGEEPPSALYRVGDAFTAKALTESTDGKLDT
jgi:hypothetical protein